MKLYLEFDSAKDIEKYRVLICQHLIDRLYAIDGMIREAKERSRQLVLIDATKHVEKKQDLRRHKCALHGLNCCWAKAAL